MNGARRRIDWQQFHDDLELRLARLNSTYEHDPARINSLLVERSMRLAKPPGALNPSSSLNRIIVFVADGERFGLPIEFVQEIRPIAHMTTLPDVPAALLGIVNWRGEFVTVLDAARWLGLAAGTAARNAILLRGDEPRIALAVGRLESVASIDVKALQSPEQIAVGRRDLFKGMSEDAVLVFDGGTLLVCLKADLRAA